MCLPPLHSPLAFPPPHSPPPPLLSLLLPHAPSPSLSLSLRVRDVRRHRHRSMVVFAPVPKVNCRISAAHQLPDPASVSWRIPASVNWRSPARAPTKCLPQHGLSRGLGLVIICVIYLLQAPCSWGQGRMMDAVYWNCLSVVGIWRGL